MLVTRQQRTKAEAEEQKSKGSIHVFSFFSSLPIRDSIVASIPACHAGDRGSIPRLGASFAFCFCFDEFIECHNSFARYILE
jgi:hypothetical protein